MKKIVLFLILMIYFGKETQAQKKYFYESEQFDMGYFYNFTTTVKKDSTVTGYMECMCQNYFFEYFVGKKYGNLVKGNMINPYDQSKTPFQYQILPNDKIKIKTPNSSDLFSGGEISEIGIGNPSEEATPVLRKIYSQPNISSPIVSESIDVLKMNFEIVEIGNYFKLNEDGKYFVWCKIKNDKMQGWAYNVLGYWWFITEE